MNKLLKTIFRKHYLKKEQYKKCWNCPNGKNGSDICSDSLIN